MEIFKLSGSLPKHFLFYNNNNNNNNNNQAVHTDREVTANRPDKGKVVPLQAWIGPEGSRMLRLPDFVTTAQDGGKVVSLTHRPLLPPGNSRGTHFCSKLSRPQGHSAIGRILCQ